MKNLVFLCLMIFSVSAFSRTPILIFSRSAYFAPLEIRRTSGLRLFDDGKVIKFSNKGEEMELATISLEFMSKVKEEITGLKIVDLVRDEGPRCMDAPKTKIEIIKDNAAVLLFLRLGCRDSSMPGADKLIRLASTLMELDI